MTDIKPKESNSIEKLEKKFKKQLIWIIVVSAIIIIGLWSWNYFYSWDNVGFGNKFNIVNSLFSGLAFAGIIITVLLQKQELTLQRKELEATRDVFLKQNGLMDRQQKNAMFFSLLENHRQLVASFIKGEFDWNSVKEFDDRFNDVHTTAISGYEVIDRIKKKWEAYFQIYSESYKRGAILNHNLCDYSNYEKIVDSDIASHLLYRELRHLYLFIQNELNNDAFYLSTLDVSLSHSEKFIFEALYQNFPSQSEGLIYKNKLFYNAAKYVNFEESILPVVKVIDSWVYPLDYSVIIETDSTINKIQLVIFTISADENNYQIEDIVPIDAGYNGISNDGDQQYNISVIDSFIKSNLNLHSFPFTSEHALEKKQFVFDVSLEKNEKEFHFYFEYSVETDAYSRASPFQKYAFVNRRISELDDRAYSILLQTLSDYDFRSRKPKPEPNMIDRINNVIDEYFKSHPEVESVKSLVLMPEFVAAGIFEKDDPKRKGLAIRNVLRDLDKNNQLDQIPFVFPDRKKKNTNWFFKRIK